MCEGVCVCTHMCMSVILQETRQSTGRKSACVSAAIVTQAKQKLIWLKALQVLLATISLSTLLSLQIVKLCFINSIPWTITAWSGDWVSVSIELYHQSRTIEWLRVNSTWASRSHATLFSWQRLRSSAWWARGQVLCTRITVSHSWRMADVREGTGESFVLTITRPHCELHQTLAEKWPGLTHTQKNTRVKSPWKPVWKVTRMQACSEN